MAAPAAASPAPAQERLAMPSPASRPPPISETHCSFSPTFKLFLDSDCMTASHDAIARPVLRSPAFFQRGRGIHTGIHSLAGARDDLEIQFAFRDLHQSEAAIGI